MNWEAQGIKSVTITPAAGQDALSYISFPHRARVLGVTFKLSTDAVVRNRLAAFEFGFLGGWAAKTANPSNRWLNHAENLTCTYSFWVNAPFYDANNAPFRTGPLPKYNEVYPAEIGSSGDYVLVMTSTSLISAADQWEIVVVYKESG